ncbi:unnamed protein product [Rhizophagus irregularis]|uniref:Uncharacterized protein n=1 Tax=Rhizophagus irregularis TaxID=588596 RepID=A0A2I1GEQ4_9GLOM|nr:hypothetical protein RhiirA4_459576 [Rhizophagus irregularis]CAB4409147.1 unnamed protein product [Rhizophagus irregularis]CAB4409516.1 unnamed protein product [Rhizophagus irregularis]
MVAPQQLKHHMKKYLQKTFISLLEHYERDFPTSSSTPPLTPIVYSYRLVFSIHQVTRLPIRTPSEKFWNESCYKLDMFLDTFYNLPIQQQIILNTEDNFHFGLTYGTVYNSLWQLNSIYGITFGPTFF